jgi:hypothetical protein
MRSNNREVILKLVTGAVVGLFLLDRFVITPAITHWNERSERIAALRKNVQRGRQLIERERSIRDKWNEMLRTDLPDDGSVAENEVFKAMGRWAQESHINFSSLTPVWKSHQEGYDTFECRATAAGDQASLGRLIYELETDPLPARLESCELATRDAKGQQLNLTVAFSFIRLSEMARNTR